MGVTLIEDTMTEQQITVIIDDRTKMMMELPTEIGLADVQGLILRLKTILTLSMNGTHTTPLVRKRASSNHTWTDKQEDILKKFYGKMYIGTLAKKLGFDESTPSKKKIYAQAYSLGLKTKKRRDKK